MRERHLLREAVSHISFFDPSVYLLILLSFSLSVSTTPPTKMPVDLISGDVRDLNPDALNTTLEGLGIARIDTAASYGKEESGKMSRLARHFTVDTKVFWKAPGVGVHTVEAVQRSFEHSLNG